MFKMSHKNLYLPYIFLCAKQALKIKKKITLEFFIYFLQTTILQNIMLHKLFAYFKLLSLFQRYLHKKFDGNFCSRLITN